MGNKTNDLVGRCPMPEHEDRNPSFAVFGTHHENCGCWRCGFSGDVFDLAQWMGRASTFPEAVQDVASTLGYYLPQSLAGTATRPATAQPRPTKQPDPPFTLSDGERGEIHNARLEFSHILHGGGPLLGEISESLGLPPEALRHASFGESGLGFANGWLCYAYPQGLKWRNPDPGAKPRFLWLVGMSSMLVAQLIRESLENEAIGRAVRHHGLSNGPDWIDQSIIFMPMGREILSPK